MSNIINISKTVIIIIKKFSFLDIGILVVACLHIEVVYSIEINKICSFYTKNKIIKSPEHQAYFKNIYLVNW